MKSFIYRKRLYKKKRFAATLNLTGSYTVLELRSILFFFHLTNGPGVRKK